MRPISLILLLTLIFPTLVRASDFDRRVDWVMTLRELFTEIEKNSEGELTHNQKHFKFHFKLIEMAWAQSAECVFAGWPSIVIQSGAKKYCTSPLNAKLSYHNGSCKTEEMQCQPLLFGKNLCVAFNSPQEKSLAFSKCEEKFKVEKRDHSFLKKLSAQEANDLQNLSILAHKICEEGSVGIQKGTGMCKKLMSKFSSGLHSIASSQKREIASDKPQEVKTVHPSERFNPPSAKEDKVSMAKVEEHQHDEDCPHQELTVMPIHSMRSIMDVGNSSLEVMYENLKADFENSPHCRPENVLYSPELPNGLLIKEMVSDFGFIDFIRTPTKSDEDRINSLMDKYQTGDSARREVLSHFSTLRTDPTKKIQEIRRILLQDYANNSSIRNAKLSEEIKKALTKNHIFSNQNGKPECPFMNKDAFMKAMKGMQNVKNKSGVRNKNLLTVVDYTKPSNSRRLFVIDLENNKIVHNTWVAHGGGGGNVFGSDGLGGSPGMSNRSGSNQSSDGFIIAAQPSYGSRFGNNLILNGIDRNNTNMRSRAVIMHGWDSPGEEIVNGLVRNGSRPVDVMAQLKGLHSQSSSSDFNDVYRNIKSATFVDKILRPTEGCLGVPRVNMSHLDPKKRNKPMIDVLREDLSGTVIFNYSGPDMKSNYF